MMQMWPGEVHILTSRGTVVVARRLYERLEAQMQPADLLRMLQAQKAMEYERLEAQMQPADLGLLRDEAFWRQMSELVKGIQIKGAPTQKVEGVA